VLDQQVVRREEIGKTQMILLLGNTILNENIKNKQSLSKCSNNSCFLFCMSIDWLEQSWFWQGLQLQLWPPLKMVGNHTGLAVALQHMLKRCIKCKIDERTCKANVRDASVCSIVITMVPQRGWVRVRIRVTTDSVGTG
jgi:hypothetical protein